MGFNTSFALGAYFIFAALFLFVILFGESDLFEGTIVAKINYWLTEGWCVGPAQPSRHRGSNWARASLL